MKAPKNCLSCSRRLNAGRIVEKGLVSVLGRCGEEAPLFPSGNRVGCGPDGHIVCEVRDCPGWLPYAAPATLPDRALIVRYPWSRFIVSGAKTLEMRGSATNVRGRIGIIEAGTHLLVGETELTGCHPMEPGAEGDWFRAMLTEPLGYDTPHGWRLENARYYPEAYHIPTKPGAVIWRILSPQLNIA